MRALETIKLLDGRKLSLPMTHSERKAWTRENFSKLEKLKYYFILLSNGKRYKVPLDKYRKVYEEENGPIF